MLRGIVLVAAGLVAVGGVLLVAFTWSFRTRFRPVQTAVRRMNRRLFNPLQMRTAGEPGAYASIVEHVGRRSGTTYRTPVVAVAEDDAFLIALPYGPGADWVRNVLAAGSATIEHEGRTFAVEHPELVPAEVADPRFPTKERRTHRRFGVTDFLQVESATSARE